MARRVADLEQRLALVEQDGGPPSAVQRRQQSRLAELESQVHDLATSKGHLEARLAVLLQALQGQDQDANGSTAQVVERPSPALFPPRPRRSKARRLLDLLHYLRYLWRRLRGHEDGPFPDHSLSEVLAAPVTKCPTLCVLIEASEGWDVSEVQRALSRQSLKPALTIEDQAPADYVLVCAPDALQAWPATLCELISLTLAMEELDYLEVLLSSTDRVLVQRREFCRGSSTLDRTALSKLANRSLGKVIDLTASGGASQLDLCFERRNGPYRYFDSNRKLVRHRLVAQQPDERPSSATQGPLLLADDLLDGKAQLFSDLFLHFDVRRLALVAGQNSGAGQDNGNGSASEGSRALSRERLGQLQKLTRLRGDAAWIYPLDEFLPAALVADAVVWLCGPEAESQKHDAVLPLNDSAAMQRILETCRSEGVPLLDPPRHKAGFIRCDLGSAPPAGRLDAGVEALRRQLNVAETDQVVLWLGDLVRSRRPEDFVGLAERFHTEGDRTIFLMVGRGPAEGTIDDLARFFGLRNFHRLPSLPLDFAVGVGDVLVMTAADQSLPYGVLAAARIDCPVVVPEGSGLSSWLSDGGGALSYPQGDLETAHSALRRLQDAALRQRLGTSAHTLVSALEDQGPAAWKRVLK